MEIFTQEIRDDKDILFARDRARVICEEMGFGITEQLQVTTSVFELGKNILEHGQGGSITFSLQTKDNDLSLEVEGQDHGPGLSEDQVKELLSSGAGSSTALRGIAAMKRLMDKIEIDSAPGEGTHIRLIKRKKESPKTLARNIVGFFQERFSSRKNPTLSQELRMQNINLMQTLSLYEEKNKELEKVNKELLDLKQRLEQSNQELQERTAELQEALLSLGDRTTELEANNRRFAAVLKVIPQGIAITDRSGVVTIVNDYFCDLFSLNRSDVEGITKVEWLDLLSRYYNDPSQSWAEMMNQIQEEPQKVHKFVLNGMSDNNEKIVCQSTPIFDDENKIVGRLWIFE